MFKPLKLKEMEPRAGEAIVKIPTSVRKRYGHSPIEVNEDLGGSLLRIGARQEGQQSFPLRPDKPAAANSRDGHSPPFRPRR